VKTREGCIALLVLGTALSAPTLLHARNNHPETPKQVQKSSKQYNKELRKEQKRQAKMNKKYAKQQAKQNKNRPTVIHSVTGRG
jgi:septal ring factor EnvC (AmiA/AmiB activator)